jgi:serine/threonine protein kinase
MNDHDIDDLLADWEIARQQGRELDAEDLAAERPHLCDELRKRITALKATSWMMDDTLSAGQWSDVELVDTRGSRPSSTFDARLNQISAHEFLESIYASGILTPAENRWLKDLVAAHGAHLDAQELADRLIDEQVLTNYQAGVLLARKNSPLVLDRYIVLDVLGAGGMGLVYKALHRSMERVVALKVLPRHAVDSPAKVQRFRREIKAAAKLTHPNIVAAYDANEADGVCFLVVEYVAGEDLKKTVLENGPLSVDDATNIIYLIASALGEAHRQDIIHRDVKPSNILLSDDGVPKLLDLGLARVKATVSQESSNQLTREGLAMGTAAYMSPEQARDPRHVDARADIYSLGCTLYFLLVGRPVFERTSSLETILAHLEEKSPTLLDADADVPPELERVFQKMIAKRPADRYANVQQVCDALVAHALVEPQLVSSSSIHHSFAGAAGGKKNGWRAALRWAGMLAAVVAVVAVTLLVIDTVKPPRDDRDVAEWAASQGGAVTAETPFGTHTIDDPTDLPTDVAADAFRVVGLELDGRQLRESGDTLLFEPVLELSGLRSLVLRNFAHPQLPLTELAVLTDLTELGLVASDLRDDDLTTIANMAGLRGLDVSNNELTDAGLTHIVTLPNLERLSLAGTAISDRGVQQLRELTQLAQLSLDRCTVTDRGIQSLLPLVHLAELSLNGTAVGDDGLAALASLPALQHIELAGTNVTLDGLAQMREFRNMRHLRVTQFDVTGELAGAIRSIPTLESLNLSGGNLDDTGIERLANLKQLKVLDIRDTAVTPAGLARLAEALPDCRVIAE